MRKFVQKKGQVMLTKLVLLAHEFVRVFVSSLQLVVQYNELAHSCEYIKTEISSNAFSDK